jgi:hypothetical protein
VPEGVYTVMDGKGNPVGTEQFRAARAPAGSRYFAEIQTDVPTPHAETIDLIVGEDGRPIRLQVDTGAHELRLDADGDRLVGTLDGEPLELPWGPDDHLDYLSPSFNAVTANLLDGTAEIDVNYLDPVTCAPRRVRQRYELLGDQEVSTPVGRFEARAWRYTAVGSGFTKRLWVAGDIVVAYEDVFELAAYQPGLSGPFPRPG